NMGMLVDIDLDQPDLAGLFGDDLFDGRTELAAGTAPGCPEIDQYRGFERGIDDIGLEAGIAAIPDEIGGKRSGAGRANRGPGAPSRDRVMLSTLLNWQETRLWRPFCDAETIRGKPRFPQAFARKTNPRKTGLHSDRRLGI